MSKHKNIITDYHNFVNVNTPKKERDRLNVGDIYINAAKCEKCGSIIRSKNRHDFVTCKCGDVGVDGGSWYIKRVFKDGAKYSNYIIYFSDTDKENVNAHYLR
ncbi:MAG: hypothetical protein GWP10_13470 [Nitrospiraceae bacterium]|nr:hypothetical protein [Nitrospiraceae bacterium]